MKMEPIVKKFYDSLEEGKIMGRKCTRCSAMEFPPVIICNACSCKEMEWVEISGTAEMFDFVLPNTISARPQLTEFMPYCYGCVRLEEGAEVNAVVCGVKKKDKNELVAKLPIPVKARIAQMNGYKTVIFEVEVAT